MVSDDDGEVTDAVLYVYYRRNNNAFPWGDRAGTSPIMMSEIMLVVSWRHALIVKELK
jgi:hypothetical protein